MKIEELRSELNEILRIFLSAKNYSIDFKYVNSVKFKMPVVYRTYYSFIDRIFHSICVALILDLCKLFDKREKYNLGNFCTKMQVGYSKSELRAFLSEVNFEELCNYLDLEKINSLMNKLKTTRDEYYAHFDRTRTNFELIQMNSSEIDELISIAENFIKALELNYFNKNIDFNIGKGELGHLLFERLNEWEKYREKYGILKDYENPEDQDPKPLTPGQKFLKKLREMPYDNSRVGQAFVSSFSKPTEDMKKFFKNKKEEQEPEANKESI